MNLEDWQELLSDPDNWPDESAKNWPADWKLFYWAAKQIHTDSVKLFGELEEEGLNELFHDVLVQLGYQVADGPSGKKEIRLSRKEEIHTVRRIAIFLLEAENKGKSSQQLSSELGALGYHA